ncbi:hypothetical protein Tco_0843306 [Tanacetum coccineum]|uniref:Uncharacterized protein n=1 Tax=Tanacetum coccineum TaxID=301880 RepID=A0ABQ5B7I2_9ASTR
MEVQNQSQMGEGSEVPTDPHHTPTIIQPSTQPQKTQKPRKPKRKTLRSRFGEDENNHSDNEDTSEMRVKKLEKKDRINAIDADEEITLFSVQNVDEEMFDVNVLVGEEVFVAEQEAAGNIVSTASDATTVSVASITTDDGDITLAQALLEMKSTKPKVKGVVIQELGESTTTISSQLSSQQSQDKGKGILIEPVMPMKKKDLIRLDEEVALKLQAEFDEEEGLVREKAEKQKEANIALIETWDHIQAKIDADHQLAERMQAQEQDRVVLLEVKGYIRCHNSIEK